MQNPMMIRWLAFEVYQADVYMLAFLWLQKASLSQILLISDRKRWPTCYPPPPSCGFTLLASPLPQQHLPYSQSLRAQLGGLLQEVKLTINVPLFKKLRDIIFFCGTITLWAISRDILRGQKSGGPLKMSR